MHRVYKIELMVIDHENLGDEGIKAALENTKYVFASVMGMDSRPIEWTDEHPLNNRRTSKAALEEMFAESDLERQSVHTGMAQERAKGK